jgi:hypothetical protein
MIAASPMGRGAARGDDGIVRPLEPELDRKVSGDHVDDIGRHEEGRDPTRALGAVGLVVVLDARDAADPGSDRDADPTSVGIVDLQPGIGDGLTARRHAVMDKLIHLFGFFFGDVIADLKAIDRTAEAGAERLDIEMGDGFDPAFAGEDVVPGGLDVQTDRRHEAQTGDHYPSA